MNTPAPFPLMIKTYLCRSNYDDKKSTNFGSLRTTYECEH